MSRNEEFKQGHTPLTGLDKSILDFESRRYKYAGQKESAAHDEFKMSPAQYYQHLNTLIDHPGAAEYSPVVVNRLQRIRDKGMKARNIRG